jgi:hypothetical protein
MTRRILVWVALAVAAGGCFDPTYNMTRCTAGGECPDGFECVGEVCRPIGSAAIDAARIDAPPIDATSIDAPDGMAADANLGECDPTVPDVCGDGWKCTGVTVNSTSVGPHCVPDGTLAVGATCTPDSITETDTNFAHDDCVGGSFCRGGTCEAICNFMVADSCSAVEACVNYGNLGVSGGVCEPGCDPVSQAWLTDGTPACGSVNPASPNRECVGSPNGPFLCAGVINSTRVHGASVPPPLYLNSCAAGYEVLLADPAISGNGLCAAFCRPQVTNQGNTAGRYGVPGSGFTCPDRGATGAECRFFGMLQDPSQPGFGNYDTYGWCFSYASFSFCETDGDNDNNDPCPSCTTMSQTVDGNGNGTPDVQDYGCAPF